MPRRLDHVRVLMYSHDTFGLGHLRRCRTIAHAIVERFKGVNVLIISGSQIAGAFDFRARVDFVKIPSVIKLYNGDYDSVGSYINVDEILHMRKLIIQRTAESFQPDIMIVDKEPLGLRGELVPTLEMLRRAGVCTVLGLRDVMDSAEALQAEWAPRRMVERIDELYDRIWVYGPERFWNPLDGIAGAEALKARTHHVGWLQRELPAVPPTEGYMLPEQFILVTAGGGGDGSALMEQALAAREHDSQNAYPLVLVLGPFMKSESRDRIRMRASHLHNVTVIDFDSRLEALLARSVGVVGMCGYNTFCEALSFDRKALYVPRVAPRQEQFIRASRARELGLCDMLLPEDAATPAILAERLRVLPEIADPSTNLRPGDLDGLDEVCEEVARLAPGRGGLPLRERQAWPVGAAD